MRSILNQADDQEKSQQVKLKGEIYSRASRVLIWPRENSVHENPRLESLRSSAVTGNKQILQITWNTTVTFGTWIIHTGVASLCGTTTAPAPALWWRQTVQVYDIGGSSAKDRRTTEQSQILQCKMIVTCRTELQYDDHLSNGIKGSAFVTWTTEHGKMVVDIWQRRYKGWLPIMGCKPTPHCKRHNQNQTGIEAQRESSSSTLRWINS